MPLIYDQNNTVHLCPDLGLPSAKAMIEALSERYQAHKNRLCAFEFNGFYTVGLRFLNRQDRRRSRSLCANMQQTAKDFQKSLLLNKGERYVG